MRERRKRNVWRAQQGPDACLYTYRTIKANLQNPGDWQEKVTHATELISSAHSPAISIRQEHPCWGPWLHWTALQPPRMFAMFSRTPQALNSPAALSPAADVEDVEDKDGEFEGGTSSIWHGACAWRFRQRGRGAGYSKEAACDASERMGTQADA